MDITPLTLDYGSKVTATFNLDSAVYDARYNKGSLDKLRALATLLDIEIPKGMYIYRSGGECILFDRQSNRLLMRNDANTYEVFNAAQMKAAYIAERIEERVRALSS